MAKYDSQFSRAAAIEEDEAMEQFYRSAPSPKARVSRQTADDLDSEVRSRGRDSKTRESRTRESIDEDFQEDSFLRARRRVPVRRGLLPSSRNGRIAFAVGTSLILAALIALAVSVRSFLRSDARLRIDSASNIQIMGNSQITRPELLSVFGSDIGRNIFFVPLKERSAELEQLPWVRHASVMRLLPNQLRVSIDERVPVAFLRNGNSVGLVDGDGVILTLPPAMMAARRFSFPVVKGIAADDPLPLRAARMHLYQKFVSDLDSGGDHVSGKLSEVDISDPEDLRAHLPAQGSDILVHFGEGDFLSRYRRYQLHLDEWRKEYPHLASVDLRYENQAVLEMAGEAEANPTPPGMMTDDADTPGVAAATTHTTATAHSAVTPHAASLAHSSAATHPTAAPGHTKAAAAHTTAHTAANKPAHRPAAAKKPATAAKKKPAAAKKTQSSAKHAAKHAPAKKHPAKQDHQAKSTGHRSSTRSQG